MQASNIPLYRRRKDDARACAPGTRRGATGLTALSKIGRFPACGCCERLAARSLRRTRVRIVENFPQRPLMGRGNATAYGNPSRIRFYGLCGGILSCHATLC